MKNLKFTCRIALLLIIICFGTHTHAQTKRFIYYFDSEMNPVPKSEAVIVGQGTKAENGGVKVGFYVIEPRRLFKLTEFIDSSLAMLNGSDIEFFENGKKKYTSTYVRDKLQGPTLKWDSTGLLTDSIVYGDDKMQNKTRYEYDFAGNPSRKIFTDSIKNTYRDIFYGQGGKKISEANFTGDKGTWKYFNTDGSVARTENVTTREKKDATYPGGEEAWKDYLAKELNATIAFENKAPEGEHVVMISFTVDKDGTVLNISPVTKQGYGMEEEALRVIQKSGKWVPASLYGKIIKSHRLQPVQFVVTKSL